MSPFLFWCRACQSKRSLSLSLSFSLSQPVHTTQSPPLSPSLSPSLIPSLSLPASLYFTSSHLLIDLYSFQAFPAALLLPVAPLIAACCTVDRRTTSCALPLSSPTISLSLSLSSSPTSAALFITCFHFSHTPALRQPHICCSAAAQQPCSVHMPSVQKIC